MYRTVNIVNALYPLQYISLHLSYCNYMIVRFTVFPKMKFQRYIQHQTRCYINCVATEN